MAGKPFKRGKRWCVVVELSPDPTTGERRQKWVYGATRKEVQEEQVKLLRERDTGTSLDPTRMTVGDYLDHWLATVVRPTKAILTYEAREKVIRNHLRPALGSIPLKKLAAAQIAQVYADLEARGYAASTIGGIHGCLHTALAKAVQWRMIPYNPASLTDPPADDSPETYIWDQATLATFLDLIRGRRHEALYLVALNTGLRIGELLGLRWTDVDLARGTIVVAQQQIRTATRGLITTKTKGKRARLITLTAGATEALRAQRVRQKEARLQAGPAWQGGERVFANATGGPLSEYTVKGDWVYSTNRWALPRMHFHGLRHLHATYLLIAGVHLKVISERLGHSSTAVTAEIYSHVTPGLQVGAAQAFEGALGAIRKAVATGDEASDEAR